MDMTFPETRIFKNGYSCIHAVYCHFLPMCVSYRPDIDNPVYKCTPNIPGNIMTLGFG